MNIVRQFLKSLVLPPNSVTQLILYFLLRLISHFLFYNNTKRNYIFFVALYLLFYISFYSKRICKHLLLNELASLHIGHTSNMANVGVTQVIWNMWPQCSFLQVRVVRETCAGLRHSRQSSAEYPHGHAILQSL